MVRSIFPLLTHYCYYYCPLYSAVVKALVYLNFYSFPICIIWFNDKVHFFSIWNSWFFAFQIFSNILSAYYVKCFNGFSMQQCNWNFKSKSCFYYQVKTYKLWKLKCYLRILNLNCNSYKNIVIYFQNINSKFILLVFI